jgi:hypothetical protein
MKAEAEHEEEEGEKEMKSMIVANHYGRRTKPCTAASLDRGHEYLSEVGRMLPCL